MTKISNYSINTHYTALKQLPNLYSASLNIASRSIPANTLGLVLGSATVSVPVGVYVENILLRSSLDGNVNHLGAWVSSTLSTYCDVYISCDHIDSDHYELRAIANNTESRAIAMPAFTVETFLRLAMAPFSI